MKFKRITVIPDQKGGLPVYEVFVSRWQRLSEWSLKA